MSRRVWIGILGGVLAAGLVVSVALGAYRAGQRHDLVVRTVGESGGEVVRVVDGPRWGYGPGPGLFLFPLLGIGLIVLLVRGGRQWGGGWSPCGPGGGPVQGLDDWHQRAHEAADRPPGSPTAKV